MITGEFDGTFPRATLTVQGRSGKEEIDFIIDTGFDGALSIPGGIANRLGLSDGNLRSITLANGKEFRCISSEANVEWDGEIGEPTEVLLLDGNPLLGVQLLAEHALCATFATGGEVTIEAV